MANPFQLDLPGRLRNFVLPTSNALVPVFEAVINGLHAIREASVRNGRIVVQIARLGQEKLDHVENVALQPIDAFVIRDNGVGFDPDNFHSFCTSDTRKKAAIGGRGVGRLTWVKAFEEVAVESFYRSKDGDLRRRTFRFTIEGISAESDEPAPDAKTTGTNVTLRRMHDNYYRSLAKGGETIMQRMVDHFLVAFREPVAGVIIEDGDAKFDVTAEIEKVLATATRETLTIADSTFELTHVKVVSNDVRGHRVAYLADQRKVKTEFLHKSIPQLGKTKLSDSGGNFWAVTLVESPLLDSVVSPERDTFHFPDEVDALNLEAQGQVTMEAIRDGVAARIRAHLDDHLGPLRKQSIERAEAYVHAEAPQYRHILKSRRDEVERLPPDLTRQELDVELRRIRFKHEEKLRADASTMLASGKDEKEAYEAFLTEVNATAIDDLAKYVFDRRIILDLLRKAVRRDAEGKFPLEAEIHRLVLPMRKTSDDVRPDQMNLWLLDERLAFHMYLASDKTMKTMPVIDSDSKARPDVIIFNRPMAFAEHGSGFQSVVIVEFKRPMREEYGDDENPILQVYDYLQEVREGSAHQRDGRTFAVPDQTPFYCYIVCDLTKQMHRFARGAGLRLSWDREGYFGYNDEWHAYVEVISFTKLVDDAEKRNRAFFEKLGLPRGDSR